MYRESPDCAVSNSVVPDLGRFQNSTKLSKFPDIVCFFLEKLPIFVPEWSRFGQNIKVPVQCGFSNSAVPVCLKIRTIRGLLVLEVFLKPSSSSSSRHSGVSLIHSLEILFAGAEPIPHCTTAVVQYHRAMFIRIAACQYLSVFLTANAPHVNTSRFSRLYSKPPLHLQLMAPMFGDTDSDN